MRKLFIVLISMAVLLLAGCGSMNPPDAYYYAQAARAGVAATVAEKPLLRITGGMTCADETRGCSIEVFDPRSYEHIGKIDRGTTSGDVVMHGLGVLGGVAQWGVGGFVVSRALREVGERQYNVTNAGDGDLTFQQDYHANSLNDDSIEVGESMHTTSTTETATTSAGDTFGDQAYNSGRLNSDDDATHAPTVVDQPTPVVIQQPAPIVVSP